MPPGDEPTAESFESEATELLESIGRARKKVEGIAGVLDGTLDRYRERIDRLIRESEVDNWRQVRIFTRDVETIVADLGRAVKEKRLSPRLVAWLDAALRKARRRDLYGARKAWLVRDGNVLLLGSRLDTAWTALPATPAFVPFVDALVNRLARGEAPVSEVEGDPRVEFRTRGADTIGATVYGLDPRESDLTPAPPALVGDVLGAEVLDATAFAAARFAGAGRHDASGLLLVLALVFALVELGVATRTR